MKRIQRQVYFLTYNVKNCVMTYLKYRTSLTKNLFSNYDTLKREVVVYICSTYHNYKDNNTYNDKIRTH